VSETQPNGGLGVPSIVGLVLGAAAAAALGAAKGVAVNDRRRSGRSKSESQALPPEPHGTQHRTLRMTDGAQIHVMTCGLPPSQVRRGTPTVVLLHGVTLSGRVWHRSMAELGRDHNVVVPDWRGHGRSIAGSDGFGLDLLASDLASILEQLDLRDCVIVGHSMGGMALMHLCGNHRSVLDARVRALMFLSTAAGEVGVATLPAAVRGAVRGVLSQRPLARRASWTLPGDAGYAMVRVTFGERPDPVWVEEARDIVGEMDPEATAASFVPLLSHNATSALAGLTLPVMVVVGTKDRLTPPAQARRIVALVPNARLVVLDGPGHMVMLERQAEFVSLVRSLTI
jgi:pimeloyl-ACP methyl ester carboxylesterase